MDIHAEKIKNQLVKRKKNKSRLLFSRQKKSNIYKQRKTYILYIHQLLL